jgi:hypothetical protein
MIAKQAIARRSHPQRTPTLLVPPPSHRLKPWEETAGFPASKKLGNQRAFSSNNLLKKDEEEKPPQMHKSASVILTNGEDSPDKKQRIRQEAVKELMSTEQDYINDLGLVEEIFIKPLTARNIIEKQDILCIFSNIEMLRGVNQEILKMFNQDPSGEHVGEAFLSIMHFFKAYTSYCANHQASLLTIKKYQTKNSSFTAFLDVRQSAWLHSAPR